MNDLFATNTAMPTPDDKTPKHKNNPELLRHTILVCTKNLMLDVGIGNLSMQKVADMAGTSKGGLFHHFKSKDELITSVVELFIAQINTAILADMDAHSDKMGAFTKAYVRVMFDNQEIGLKSDWAGLIRAMTTNVQMYGLWRNWLAQKIKTHAGTDSNPRLSAIRCAVDGAWLNGIPHDELPAMRAYLLKLADDVH
ncbi:TetR/AcrR family transcriptional regulator [Moraxella nonliquefaciens]|uniref:TetR/AcrR family transcriptional regulator n=1 Tax=Moraxella nonliquefaciens TaxID=478 RepID=UPI001EF5C5FC|nr:TetR/AcrR family transcriptional regulator [Moraxella nonliquefaciens]MCG7411903.1 TetR/AcrR family transcriptional regulator [Moraxella nonliquefaciens]